MRNEQIFSKSQQQGQGAESNSQAPSEAIDATSGLIMYIVQNAWNP